MLSCFLTISQLTWPSHCLVGGWPGLLNRCSKSHSRANLANSWLLNWGPLSEIITHGDPNRTKRLWLILPWYPCLVCLPPSSYWSSLLSPYITFFPFLNRSTPCFSHGRSGISTHYMGCPSLSCLQLPPPFCPLSPPRLALPQTALCCYSCCTKTVVTCGMLEVGGTSLIPTDVLDNELWSCSYALSIILNAQGVGKIDCRLSIRNTDPLSSGSTVALQSLVYDSLFIDCHHVKRDGSSRTKQYVRGDVTLLFETLKSRIHTIYH